MYVKPANSQMRYLLTYKLSQDHIELFFCAIRACGGWCPNPTCSQFVSAYKRLLIRHEVNSTNGNSAVMDCTKILHVSSTNSTKKRQLLDPYDPSVYDAMTNIRLIKKHGLADGNGEVNSVESRIEQDNTDVRKGNVLDEFLHFGGYFPNELTDFSNASIANMSGWVVRKILTEKNPTIRCQQCKDALLQSDSEIVAESPVNALIEVKTRGGLIFPSKSVIDICRHCESRLRKDMNRNNFRPSSAKYQYKVCHEILRDLIKSPCQLFPTLNEHILDAAMEELSHHLYTLIKKVCNVYIHMRYFSLTKMASEHAVGIKIRHYMNRQIIWKFQ